MPKKTKPFDFSANVAKIDEIVAFLEQTEDIQEAIKQYKSGIELIKDCQKYLAKAKNEIKVIKES